MYTTPQTDSISHFQIAGIHGLPYVQWEGAGGTSPVQGSGSGGYCTHGSVLFPTWHRPYVALYEVGGISRGLAHTTIFIIIQQVMQQHALEIAKTYPTDQQQWISAAQDLRAPYWDWATNSVPPPEVISLQTVNIITADGGTTSVPNPLYQYTFNPIDPSFRSPWTNWKTTIRHPDNPRSPDATTDSEHLRRYDFILPDSNFYHLFFLPKVTFRRSRTTSPQVPTTFCPELTLGLRSATTPPVTAAALVTL